MRIELTREEVEELKRLIEKSDENKQLTSIYNKLSNSKGFGAYLTQLRLKMDMSQRELAKATGISHSEICRLEKSQRMNPSINTLLAISNATNVSLEEIISKYTNK